MFFTPSFSKGSELARLIGVRGISKPWLVQSLLRLVSCPILKQPLKREFNQRRAEMLALKRSALIGLLLLGLIGGAIWFNQATSSLISSQEAPLLLATGDYSSGGG